jgi:hypothetical protein
MKIAFLTEMGFEGKIPSNHPNMRTEFAWMHALDADHFCIHDFLKVKDYDHIFVIFPKGRVYLDACGSQLTDDQNPASDLLLKEPVEKLKLSNKKVYVVQEGPHWWWNDYNMYDQVRFFNMMVACDGIFAHNEHDVKYYKGVFPSVPVHVIPTLMIDSIVKDIQPSREEMVIIGGNFVSWYGGFDSFIIAQEFDNGIVHAPSMGRKQQGEEQLIKHLPYLNWKEWIHELNKFKYGIHLMRTHAAGTFALNCAYLGIPCIGYKGLDTQEKLHPALTVDIGDLSMARKIAMDLRNDEQFYLYCSDKCKQLYKELYNENKFYTTFSKQFKIS